MAALKKAAQLTYEEIKVGDRFSFDYFIDENLVNRFAEVSGDYNPLHVKADYAEKTEFHGRIAHGMLLASLFSNLIGMHCPGERALYLSQEIRFRNPLPLNRRILISGEVVSKSDAVKIIELKTIINDEQGAVIVDGLARVRVRD